MKEILFDATSECSTTITHLKEHILDSIRNSTEWNLDLSRQLAKYINPDDPSEPTVLQAAKKL